MFEWGKALPDILLIMGIMIAIRISFLFRKTQSYNKKIQERKEQLEKAGEILDEIWPDRPGVRRKERKARQGHRGTEVIGNQ
ncbi:hypothetical protein AUJ95_02085 [Candidatus Desantisbacteria bacterium CG2_30_40_21]|uniref:Uncharacterized protein n=5 Tax=unclassified Candidatus Desantisiibacteriota TaxID=3106372 RepID=A0A2M7JD38_9BACT|nr:MAG: hypothetical protein AUJ95_02085 [Candidatus Desantisbacteria bacterium CG2_30_40_21]PIP41932.1 MAG: hypothetical protein COX18_01930 [Candidatus Desantisbacteria bacterium CG23_combo_of_CG06-09_8_20_14_all_40_23]PIX17339.1 MAG: hypothetical protein COZ71_03855 [Candidatus Desantisbacteria bacterium CG_4_8_14_3_um_filter_40_12]PIY19777.1 MAG: hypothetical protein COZ13_03600 [Candidatus Desantisbacteria bacterium CG_4_10_14_3_um_filter_40_18]PJB28687.1 MAG: hypothetical protein CO110_08